MTSGRLPKDVRKTNIVRWGLFLIIFVFLLNAGPVWASSDGGDHGSAAPGWLPTDTYRILNFVVLAGALYFVLRKPVAQALQGRIKGIKDELDELEARKQEAEGKLAQYDEKLALLDKEAKKIIEAYVEQGKEAQARILEQAKASAEKLEAHAQRQIENAFERAGSELQAVILEKAIEKAEAAIKKNISADDQDRLVNEYLEKVVA